MELIRKHTDRIVELCRQYNAIKLYVFGSAVSDNFKPDSDIDFLVKFGEVDLYDYFDNYMDLKESLEKLFERKVDLVEEQSLKNPVLIRSIEKNKQLIYGREDSKMAV